MLPRIHDALLLLHVAGGFVAVVALSAGIVAVRSGATLPEAGAVVLAGALVGGGLLLVLRGGS